MPLRQSSCHPSSQPQRAPSIAHGAHSAPNSPTLSQTEKLIGVAKNHVAPHPGQPPAVSSPKESQERAPTSLEATPASTQQDAPKTPRKLEKSKTLASPNILTPPIPRSATLEDLTAVTTATPRLSGSPNRRRTTLQPLVHRSESEVRLFADDTALKSKRRKKKPLSVSLEVIQREERARLGFFRFIQAAALQDQLEEESEESTRDAPPLRKDSRPTVDYRENCVLFWLEINDLLKIPANGAGSFQLGLMTDLFDVYVAKNSPRELPMVSAAERETLSQCLQDRNVERAMLSFKMLLLDVLEVVTTVFDEYVRAEGRLGYYHAMRAGSMRNVLARIAKMSVGKHQVDRRGQLHEIISAPAVCRMFREFLTARNSVENLLFIIDALAFEDLVNNFEREPSLIADQDGSHQDYCLRQAQKIFNKYIRYGSKAEICLGTTAKEKVLQEIVEYPLSPELFNEPVLLCCAELVNSHLDLFYRSVPYLEYQAAMRKSNGQNHSAVNAKDPTAPVEPAPGAATAASTTTSPPNSRAPSLPEILNGVGVNYFRDFLKEEGLENTIFFYKEVSEFQRLPHGQKHYIQNKARKLFERFVRRGGKLEIELPPEIRRDILWKLSAPNEATFTDAQKYIFTLWEYKYLAKFRSHKLHQEMLSQSPAPSTVRDGSGDGANAYVSPLTGGGGDWVDVSRITLREFLDVELLRRFFRLFLEKEQCANELYFYFEIAHFQQFPTSDYLTRQAKKLVNRFCDPESREFVNISDLILGEIQENLAHARPAMFNKAQEEIYSFFVTTLFPKFQQSEVYTTIRITSQELRVAKLSSVGATSQKDVRQGTKSGATAAGGSGGGGSGTGDGARNRNSAAAFGAGAGPRELSEESVTASMILENADTRALFLFFAEEMYVLWLLFG